MRSAVRNLWIVPLLLCGAAPALAGPPAKTPPGKTETPAASASAAATTSPAAPAGATSSPTAAQPASDLDPSVRSSYLDAMAASAKGDHAKAAELLGAAWKSKPHWQIAASLGAEEMALDKPADAAGHFAYAQRNAPADQQDKLGKLLAEATAKCGTIVVSADPSDVVIFLDGAQLDVKSGEPFYVTPDEHHKVTVRRGAQSEEMDFVLQAGKRHEAKVVVLDAPRSRAPVFVLGGVALASAITGAVLTGIAQSNGADLLANAPKGTDGQPLCRKTPAPSGANTAECDAWRAKARDAATMGNVGIGMFALAGAAAVGAAAWALWPSPTKTNSAAVQVMPVAGVDGVGALVRGRF